MAIDLKNSIKFFAQFLAFSGGFICDANADTLSDRYYTIAEKECKSAYIWLTGPRSIDLRNSKDDDLVYNFNVRLAHRVGISNLDVVRPSIAFDLDNVYPVSPDQYWYLNDKGEKQRSPRLPRSFPSETNRFVAQLGSSRLDLTDQDQTEFTVSLPVKNLLARYVIPKHMKTGTYWLGDFHFELRNGARLLCEIEFPDGVEIKVKNDP